MADSTVPQLPEGYQADDLLGNAIDGRSDRFADAGLLAGCRTDRETLVRTCELVAGAFGDGDYDVAADAVWERYFGAMLDRIAAEVVERAGGRGDDPHEVDHSWVDDGTGHCKVCGAPSADLEAREPERPLRFYDVTRQHYAATAIVDGAGEFMVGDYDDDGSVDDGEFKIVLHGLSAGRGLTPQVCAFGDATATLSRAIGAGLLDALRDDVAHPDEFSRRLLALGFVDKSDRPLTDGEGR